jgi:glucokinase
MTEPYVGVDVGASKIAVGLFDGRLSSRPLQYTNFATTGEFRRDISNIGNAIARLTGGFHVAPAGIGIGLPGRLDERRTTILGAGSLAGWVNQPVLKQLREWWQCPAVLGNDAEAQAMAEARHNPKAAAADFLLMAVGTGIGLARAHRLPGSRIITLPMEPHFSIDPYGPESDPCGCGSPRCWEPLGSGSGAERRYGKLPSQLGTDDLSDMAAYLARGLAVILPLHHVSTVVCGGGVMARVPQLVGLVRDHLERLKPEMIVPVPRLVPSVFLNDADAEGGAAAGMIGGLALLDRLDLATT